jgi:hypothetical protein
MQISESETEALKEPELAETENGETGVEQSQEHALRFLITSYGDGVIVHEDFDPKFGDNPNCCCITTAQSHTSFFAREF